MCLQGVAERSVVEERRQLSELLLVVDARQATLDVLEGAEEIVGRWRDNISNESQTCHHTEGDIQLDASVTYRIFSGNFTPIHTPPATHTA